MNKANRKKSQPAAETDPSTAPAKPSRAKARAAKTPKTGAPAAPRPPVAAGVLHQRHHAAVGSAATTAPAPTTGSIKLEVASLSTPAIISYLNDLVEGLRDNPYYATLPATIPASLQTSLTALVSLSDSVVYYESQARAAKSALENATVVAKDDIRTAAFGCEQVDRTDEALISANWKLRRTPGPAQLIGTPTRLRLKNSPLPGEIRASWSAVDNFRFYQVQTADPETTPPVDWDTIVPITATRALISFTGLPVGRYLAIRVRAVGVRGPGAWTDVLTARVN